MAESDNGSRTYVRARIAAGLFLVALVALLAIIDTLRSDYAFDPISLGLILGAGLLFLGVEGGASLIRRIAP